MKLILRKLPYSFRGVYTDKAGRKDALGVRQLYAHPDAADSLIKMESDGLRLIFSDIFRSPKESLEARRKKPGLVKRPGESPHNFGLAIDLDITAICNERRITKAQLDALMISYGWYPHNKDSKVTREGWHYNYLGPKPELWLPACAASSSTSRAVEARVMALYGSQMTLSKEQVEAALDRLDYETVADLQGAWDLDVDGVAGVKTQRLLACLTADQEIV